VPLWFSFFVSIVLLCDLCGTELALRATVKPGNGRDVVVWQAG
jgi:hypothetical protein